MKRFCRACATAGARAWTNAAPGQAPPGWRGRGRHQELTDCGRRRSAAAPLPRTFTCRWDFTPRSFSRQRVSPAPYESGANRIPGALCRPGEVLILISGKTPPRKRAAPSIVAAIAGMSVVAGLLVSAIALPLVGGVGMVTRQVSDTFNNLQVPALAQLPSRSEILDSNGKVIADYYPNHIYRVPVSYNQISPYMRQAIVAIEDDRFYQDGALDPRGSLRALITDFTGGQGQG